MAEEYWFNTETGEVETGRQSSWTHLMGPYPTYEAARAALDTAHRRTEAWDDDEQEWREGR